MLLAIDVGNTNMVFGMFEGETFTGSFRLMTDANRTSDEIGLSAWEYFQRFGLKTEDVENVIIASVVPQVMHTLTNAMVKYFGKTPIIVDEDVDPGLPYGVSGDERLGADRSVACIAALEKYGAPLVVLDFGTATTVDAVNREGAYMGGCITAGAGKAGDCAGLYCGGADPGRDGAGLHRSHGVSDPDGQRGTGRARRPRGRHRRLGTPDRGQYGPDRHSGRPPDSGRPANHLSAVQGGSS